VTTNHTNKLLEILYGFRVSKFLIYRGLKARAKRLVGRLAPHLPAGELVLDIGPASCTVPELLMEKGMRVVPLDVQNYSIADSVAPILYNGDVIPFRDKQFGASLILFVLHHTPEPEKLLREAMRASSRIIVYEDIVLSPLHKRVTSFADMLINLEFDNQPHTNKSDAEWLAVFERLGLNMIHREYASYALVFRHAMYVVEQ
jgi:ubiquinone/menaquinone biosynthesis C-methylase UbiE